MNEWAKIVKVLDRRPWRLKKEIFLFAIKPIAKNKLVKKMSVWQTHDPHIYSVIKRLKVGEIGKIKLSEPLLKVVGHTESEKKGTLTEVLQANIEYVLRAYCNDLIGYPELYNSFLIAVNEWREKIGEEDFQKLLSSMKTCVYRLSFAFIFTALLMDAVLWSQQLTLEEKEKLYIALEKSMLNIPFTANHG